MPAAVVPAQYEVEADFTQIDQNYPNNSGTRKGPWQGGQVHDLMVLLVSILRTTKISGSELYWMLVRIKIAKVCVSEGILQSQVQLQTWDLNLEFLFIC